MIGNGIGVQQKDPSGQGVGESGRATKIMEAGWPGKANDEAGAENVLVHSKSYGAHDGRYKAAVNNVIARLDDTKYVRKLESPYAKHENSRISKDAHTVLVKYEVKGDFKEAQLRIVKPLAAIDAAAKANPGISMRGV